MNCKSTRPISFPNAIPPIFRNLGELAPNLLPWTSGKRDAFQTYERGSRMRDDESVVRLLRSSSYQGANVVSTSNGPRPASQAMNNRRSREVLSRSAAVASNTGRSHATYSSGQSKLV